ncbi:MAG: ABC transporter ATP-binding protein [Verrucomicrobiota bacterium JB024]|nr:ABC transporter ATP-binding protein [Verrucomicrobiota bacterium JB024]
MPAFFEFRDIGHQFGKTPVVEKVNLSLNRGEVFSLVGPSGCGKTTLLRIAAGFIQPTRGAVLLDGEDITALPPDKRKINTVFQNYALFPHLSVFENIAFGLRVAKKSKTDVTRAVGEMLELIDLAEHARKKPAQLSGGQKQRVAIARALVNQPDLLLLDEPLAALDLKLRQRMLLELDRIHEEVGTTFLYVTHDQTEAMSLSDRIGVMHQGKLLQVGTPAEIYESPESSFVAAFIGDTNFVVGKVRRIVDENRFVLEAECLGEIVVWRDKPVAVGDQVTVSIRPEKFSLQKTRPATNGETSNSVPCKIEEVIYLGPQTRYWVRSADQLISVIQQHANYLLDETPLAWGDEAWLTWRANDGFMLNAYREADEALLTLPDD